MGIASEKILSKKPLKVAASLLIFYLGLASINTGQILRGSNHTFQNYKVALSQIFGSPEKKVLGATAEIKSGYQEVTIEVTNNAYNASAKIIKKGVPVRLTLNTKGVRSCSRAFVIPDYNISKILPETGTEVLEFTPTKTGLLTYSCSMGMYTGSFNVVQ